MSRIRKWIFRIEIARFTQWMVWDAEIRSKSYWTLLGLDFGYIGPVVEVAGWLMDEAEDVPKCGRKMAKTQNTVISFMLIGAS